MVYKQRLNLYAKANLIGGHPLPLHKTGLGSLRERASPLGALSTFLGVFAARFHGLSNCYAQYKGLFCFRIISHAKTLSWTGWNSMAAFVGRRMNITIAGIGYVGLSLAVLLAQHNNVTAVDIVQERVDALNSGVSPIKDELISEYLAHHQLSLSATLNARAAYKDAELVIVATPTSYDPQTNSFDTSHVEEVVRLVEETNPHAAIVVKSTVPVGYTQELARQHPQLDIVFSPEFLREGRALYDNLHPSRIIVGTTTGSSCAETTEQLAHTFAKLLDDGASEHGIPTLFMSSTEAEAVKLFANTYLAMRVSFFNELDSYAQTNGLDASKIIEGIGLDARIGRHYNNPSFGYGGYCLPKDTRQLLANFEGTPQRLMSAIVSSNDTRKDFVAAEVARLARERAQEGETPTVGIYRLTMKSGSDNFRDAAILGVIDRLRNQGLDLVIFEPALGTQTFDGIPVEQSLGQFANRSTIIVTNRWDSLLTGVADKVYTRDIFRRD